jgi:hypothetical protein
MVGSNLLSAGVVNGDFSSGTNNWSFYFAPGNVQIPGYGVTQIDIDGAGPLSNSPAFRAAVGSDALMNLEQNVSLIAGGAYTFRADLAMTPTSNNADGGTVAVYFGPTLLISHSFGSTTVGVNEYATISKSFSPAFSGSQTLSIRFSRGYGYGAGNTPADYIDNVYLNPPPIILEIQCTNNVVVLRWTNVAYTLQSAPTASGVYTNVIGASSPYTNSFSVPQQYFRLKAD